MIMCVDIGNSDTVFGIYNQDKLIKVIRITTYKEKTKDEFFSFFRSLFNNDDNYEIDRIVMCSVVPTITLPVTQALVSIFNCKVLQVESGIKTGILIKADDPSEVGADLVAGAVGVINKYDGACILVDLGTATKFIVIDNKQCLCGVSIAPGLKISLDALTNKASQLKEVSLRAPKYPYGKNTTDSMNAGIIFGNCSMIEGMVKRIEKTLGYKAKTIITGGLSSLITEHLEIDYILDENVVLDGLYFINRRNKDE